MNIKFLPLLGVLIQGMLLHAQTTTKLSPIADTEIDQGGGASSYLGANSAFTISPWTTASASKRAVIRFNLSGFPSGCTIHSAWLVMQEYNTQGTSRQINVHRLTTTWTESSTNWPAPWSASGGDYAATAVGSFTPVWTGVIKQDSVNLTTSVQSMVDGTYSNYGWLLKIATEDATQQYWAFYSKESPTAAYRPFLRIRYSGCTVLPVELIDFSAKVKNNNEVELTWQTASELNNDFFTVQRSEDASSWKEIVHLDGAGNSKNILNYAYLDAPPPAEIVYYRLKQTDFDGKYSYSSIQPAILHSDRFLQPIIYPNPADDVGTIVAAQATLSQLKIFDVFGQDVTAQTVATMHNSNECTVHLENLPSGIYYIQMGTTFYKLLRT